jgi:stage II sporulation protein B
MGCTSSERGAGMMEKDDRQISIRINGKETKLDEQETERETAAAEEKGDEFQWVLPDQEKGDKKVIDFQKHFEGRQNGQPIMIDDRQGDEPLPVKGDKKHSRIPKQKRMSFTTFPKKILYAILAAITIGLIFGLFMLMLFTQTNIFSENVEKSKQSESIPTTNMNVDSLNLDLTIFVVQGGAFSSEDKGRDIVNEVIKKGYAAVLDTSEEPIRMFIGITSSQQAASLMSSLYNQNGQDTYQKQLKISSEANYTSEQTAGLASGKQLLEKMFNMTAYQITQAQPFDEKEWQGIKGQFQEWEQQLKGITFENNKVEEIEQFKGTLKEAVVSFHAYEANKETKELWKTEQLLLDTFISYKNLLK